MTKKLLSVFLTIALVFNFALTILVSAEETTQDSAPYQIEYKATDNWGNTQTAEIKITNTGSSDIEGWAIRFTAEGTITGLWGAVIYQHEGTGYILESTQYNTVIKSAQSITVGYQYASENKDKPENIRICSKRDIMQMGYSISFQKTGGWDQQATCQLTISNTGITPIKLWELSFDKLFISFNPKMPE